MCALGCTFEVTLESVGCQQAHGSLHRSLEFLQSGVLGEAGP